MGKKSLRRSSSGWARDIHQHRSAAMGIPNTKGNWYTWWRDSSQHIQLHVSPISLLLSQQYWIYRLFPATGWTWDLNHSNVESIQEATKFGKLLNAMEPRLWRIFRDTMERRSIGWAHFTKLMRWSEFETWECDIGGSMLYDLQQTPQIIYPITNHKPRTLDLGSTNNIYR